MQRRSLGPVPAAYADRLRQWLGPEADPWMADAPVRLQAAADRWLAVPIGYHDAGATSVKVIAHTDDQPLMLKTWFDRAQGEAEVRALHCWAGGPAVRVTAYDDELGVAALELIAARPGGAASRSDDVGTVAKGLDRLHHLGRDADLSGFTILEEHAQKTLLPALARSLHGIEPTDLRKTTEVALADADRLLRRSDEPTLLHGNLYRDHVLFDHEGQLCFIDPTAIVGDPVYDWASWVVLYDRAYGHQDRLDAAVRSPGIDPTALVSWATLIAADELAFRIETSSSGIRTATETLRWAIQRSDAATSSTR